MTPKEKAKELVDIYYNLFTIDLENTISIYESAKCALKTVDQMILVLPFTDTNASLNYYSIHLKKYLEQVKQEIENYEN